MAIYHLSAKIISRSQGRSAVGSSAYRAGEKMTNEYDGMTHDFTKKKGIVFTEIMLCESAPERFSDRQTLWNEVERSEKAKNAQTAREIEVALPNELARSQQIDLIREYVKENFTNDGMCADIAIHDKGDGNPHAHVMLTMRKIDEQGNFMAKSKKVYMLNENGEKIVLPSGNFKTYKQTLTNWDDKDTLEQWRSNWAQATNEHLEIAGHGKESFIDNRSFEKQGTEMIPTVHLGYKNNVLEKRGIETEIGNINREIAELNKAIKEIHAERLKLTENGYDIQELSKDDKQVMHENHNYQEEKQPTSKMPEEKSHTPKAVFDKRKINLIVNIEDKIKNHDKPGYEHYAKLKNLQEASKTLSFLTENKIDNYDLLEAKVKIINSAFNETKDSIKAIEDKLSDMASLIKNIKTYQETKPVFDQYQKAIFKDKFKKVHEGELRLYQESLKALKEHNFSGKVNLTEIQKEYMNMKNEKDNLYKSYAELKEKSNLFKVIKTNVDKIIEPKSKEKSVSLHKDNVTI